MNGQRGEYRLYRKGNKQELYETSGESLRSWKATAGLRYVRTFDNLAQVKAAGLYIGGGTIDNEGRSFKTAFVREYDPWG